MTPAVVAPSLTGNALGSSGNSLVVAEWRDGGGPTGERRLIAPPHVHQNDDEARYVLEGALCIHMGEKVVEARAGSGVLVPRGTPHTYWNPGPSLTRYLLVMTANIYQLIQDIHAMKERTPAALEAEFGKHDSMMVKT